LANSLAVRRSAKEGAALPKDITADLLADDKLLIPVLEDDALIFCLDDLPEPAAQGQQQSSSTEAKGKEAQAANGEGGPAVDDLLQKNAQLQTELEQLSKQFTNYRLAVESTLDKRWGVDDESQKAESSGKTTVEPAPKQRDESAYYFESYAHIGKPPFPLPTNSVN
jgi:protein arginine N-methyltransferase 3